MEWLHCSYRTVLVMCGTWVTGSDSLSCFCSMCLTTGQETSTAAWLTLAGSLGTAMCYMGPSAMEQPVFFLRALQFTLILVRTGNPNWVLGSLGRSTLGDTSIAGLSSESRGSISHHFRGHLNATEHEFCINATWLIFKLQKHIFN